MDEMVYLNGAIKPRAQATISVMDYGFLFGYGLFETMRAYSGKVFRLKEHMDRLGASASRLGISIDRPLLERGVYDILDANRLTSARVRLVATIGEGSLTPNPSTCSSPTTIIMSAEYHPYDSETYANGWNVSISRIRRNSGSPLPGMKSSNFLESILAKQEARAAGADDTLMVNDKGFLAEASSSNVFVLSHGMLKTPRLGDGLLPGVTRQLVLQIASNLGVPATEADILPGELGQATEVFLTNSMIEIMPVAKVAGERVGDGRPGAVTVRLMSAYMQQVRTETQ